MWKKACQTLLNDGALYCRFVQFVQWEWGSIWLHTLPYSMEIFWRYPFLNQYLHSFLTCYHAQSICYIFSAPLAISYLFDFSCFTWRCWIVTHLAFFSNFHFLWMMLGTKIHFSLHQVSSSFLNFICVVATRYFEIGPLAYLDYDLWGW